ncbi:YraN family protein [Syntrophaceticus schinkii]|jgi:putative endonuclease|nr:YraN family protein [Syntrophaceticus schinkii]
MRVQMGSSRNLGILGEETALSFLSRLGYHLLERNYRCRLGEIDLIMQDGSVLVFIEVKARRSALYGKPQEAVGAAKQARIRRLAEHYLLCKGNGDYGIRFDVVAVSFKESGNYSIDHIKNAF